MKPFFSIIVPVYQAQKVISKCIDGVTSQSCSDWELILVNDGSKDESLKICEEYSARDFRIQVISQQNCGAAAARNNGVEHAIGDYILFLDSDDYWEDVEALDMLRNQLRNECDICLYGCWDEYPDGKRIQSRGNYCKEAFLSGGKKTILDSLIVSNQFPGSCWIMAIKRKLLTDNSISFVVGHRAEDVDWIIQIIRCAEKICFIDKSFYVYKKNQINSITGTAGLKSIQDILMTLSKWTPVNENEKDQESYNALKDYMAYMFFTTIVIYGTLSREDRHKAKIAYSETYVCLKGLMNKRNRILGLLYSVVGLDATASIIKLLRGMGKK